MPTSYNPLLEVMPAALGKAPHIRKPGHSEAADKINEKLANPLPIMPEAQAATGPSLEQQLHDNNKSAQDRQAVLDSTSFVDVARAKFTDTFLMAAIRRETVNQLSAAYPADPTYKIDPKVLAGYNTADQEWLASSQSAHELEVRKWDLQDYAEQQEIGNRKGEVVGFAASFMAGMPEGVITGVATARAFHALGMGAQALANSGRQGAAVAATLAENIGGNVAMTVAQSAYDTHIGPSDYAFGVAFGGLGTLLSIPSIKSDIHAASTVKHFEDMQTRATEDGTGVIERAQRGLPEGATPNQIKTEAARIDQQEALKVANPGEMPVERQIFPIEDTTIRVDVPEEGPKPGQDGPATATKTEADVVAPPEEMNAATAQESGLPALPRDLAGAKPRWKTFDINFASDVDKALFITSQAKKSKADAQYRAWLKDTVGMSDEDISVYGKKIRDNIKAAEKEQGDTGLSGKPEPNTLTRAVDLEAVSSGWDTIQARLTKLQTHPRSELRMVADRLIRAVGDRPIKVEVKTPDEIRAMSKGMVDRSHYNRITHSVVLDTDSNKLGREWVVLHEAAHAATVHRLAWAKDNPLSGAGRIRAELESIRETARSVLDKRIPANEVDKRKLANAKYYLENEREFIAAFYSTRESAGDVFDVLRSIPMDNGKTTALSAFVQAIKKLLGITPEESNAFTRALGLTDDLMDIPLDIKDPFTGKVVISQAPPTSNDPVSLAHGLHLLPTDTPAKAAEVKAMRDLYAKADRLAPVADETRLSKLMNTAMFSGGQATANVMLRSKNSVTRWIASELLESPGGAGGRRSTAAIQRHLNERQYLGNTLNEVQNQYTLYRKNAGVSFVEDYSGGKTWERFNRQVAEEMESRKPGAQPVVSTDEVRAAADSLEKAYERMRIAQINAKTVGWASLPESSIGYMPHRMSGEKILNLSMAQRAAVQNALVDQFITIEGWDISFADALAAKYMDRVNTRALGGFDAPVGIHQTGAADIVEEALTSMGMDKTQVKAMMTKMMNAGPGYTKRRIRLDLNQVHTLDDGTEFRLMDVFDTDQFSLLRSQAGRVSGETALAQYGIMGKAHLNLLRQAMMQGDNTNRATAREMQAFDQVAAEFINAPFGSQNKWVDRIMQYNSLARLGGMGFTQAAESLNGMVSIGVAKTFASIGSMKRMRDEILALSRGETVENPLLHSIEKVGGAEFGTDAYKIVFPFDNGSLEHQTYGSDTITLPDRLLRSGAHMQAKLSFWRAFHSTQQRGMAEQIVRKSMEMVRAGGNDVALRDMGISDELMTKLRSELDNITTFKGDRVERVDLTKMTDQMAANEYVQAIHRGVSQIIQETFIGEKGAWVHDPYMRLLTQFRTFSITSIEKQWARQRGNIGTAKSLGIIMAAMAVATPLYMTRTYLQSIGRADQEAYLEGRLSYYNIARATMNYVAATGLAGDVLDMGQAIGGRSFQGDNGRGTGGAAAKGFVGNMVAPSVGTVDDAWKAIQNTKDGTDTTAILKTLPGSRLPFLLPAINALGN